MTSLRGGEVRGDLQPLPVRGDLGRTAGVAPNDDCETCLGYIPGTGGERDRFR
jgi:hypothetical protein